jgi:hypothetical protein
MKTLLILFGVLLISFFAIQIFAMRAQSNIESYPYTVVKKHKTFEIRSYEASLFTAVQLPTGQYENASRKGFSILASYIFGGNDKNEKIAMTSPVAMSLEDSMTVMFMVPKELSKEMLPKPNDSTIQLREEPAKMVAAIEFGGWANDSRIEKYKNELIQALAEQGIEHNNRFYFLGYNPPFEVLNRRNEIIVELKTTEAVIQPK